MTAPRSPEDWADAFANTMFAGHAQLYRDELVAFVRRIQQEGVDWLGAPKVVGNMAVFYDTKEDAACIALCGGIGPGETARNTPACDGKIVLNFNVADQLIGIELLDMDMLHPDLAKHAIQMRPIREGDL